MTEIIIVRHGETRWNAGEIFRGRRDIGLNDNGKKQAQLLGTYLIGANFEAVYSSPLSRALETCCSVAEKQGLSINIASDLIDFDYGEWEGLAHSLVQERYSAVYKMWLKEPHLVDIPGGESLADVRKRARSIIDTVISKHSGRVLLVSHRVVIKVLTCYMLGLDSSHFWLIRHDLGGITIFKHDRGRFILVRHNDISYLGNETQITSDF